MKLRAENLVKTYKKRSVVKGISVEVNQGEIVGLLGPNGAGKTTSFYMIVGLVKPNSGNIYLDDMDITNFPMYKRAQNGIGYLAQEASVFRKLSIEDNILSVLQLTTLSKEAQIAKMEELIAEFSLEHIRTNRGDLLSGGERRRTEIARALATDPKFILQETLAITDKTYLMFEGGILKAGKPEELVEDEMVRRVYLGQNFELRKTKIDFNAPKVDIEI
jgi:lipopolysaccharide export system ATP-binding protein